jgi:hypothetical protein
MAVIEGTDKVGTGLGVGEVKLARGFYEFALDGGVVGDIALRGDTIPSGAIITDALINVDTAVTSGGSATVALKVEGSADLLTAAAISGAPWSTTGAKRATFVATTAPVKTTAKRSITATVATAALTAGKFSVVVSYLDLA